MIICGECGYQIPVTVEESRFQQVQAADAHLTELWRGLRDGASAPQMFGADCAVKALEAVSALTKHEAELWHRRFRTCPGHNDEGGRDWCAFCGQLPNGDRA